MLIPDIMLPDDTMPRGHNMFGYSHGVVILPNLQLQDTAEVSRSFLVNNGILTFDPNWSRPVKKTYLFAKVCMLPPPNKRSTFDIFQDIFDRDIGHVTRLWTPDWIEYGFVDPDQTSFKYYQTSVDINLSLVSVLEYSLRS